MPISGPLSHIDLSVGDPARSIPFYAALLGTLGFERRDIAMPEWQGEHPTRATWAVIHPNGARFEIELRPARSRRRYDRYEPGPHHLAFHAESREIVDRAHAALLAIGAEILDPPADYSGQPGYAPGYYAAFFADPDGVKLEVVYLPEANP